MDLYKVTLGTNMAIYYVMAENTHEAAEKAESKWNDDWEQNNEEPVEPEAATSVEFWIDGQDIIMP